MKQEKNIETKAQGIKDALTGMYKTISWIPSNYIIFTIAHTNRNPLGGLRVGYGREGPPGRARSPGTGIFPVRDHPPDGTKGILLSKYNYEFTMNIKEFTMYNNLNINILIKNNNFLTTNFLTINF